MPTVDARKGLALTMTACDRPWHLRRVLEALARCEGIADCLLLPRVEPGNDEVRALVEGFDACECRPTWNASRLGCNRNTVGAIDAGFATCAGFVVYLDDDTPLAPDALRYFAHCRDAYGGDPSVFSVGAYGPKGREQDIPPEADWHRVERACWFHPWGWATWGDRWAAVRPMLEGVADPTWDVVVNTRFVVPGGLREVRPMLSRSQNIGRRSSRSAEDVACFRDYDRAIKLRHWAGDLDVPPGAFHE